MRGSFSVIAHCDGSRPTRSSTPACTVWLPDGPVRTAPRAPPPYGLGGGVMAGTAPVSGKRPTRSAGSGWPHEKQKDACPGVAVVSAPHDGHVTETPDPAPPPSTGDGATLGFGG